MKKKALKALIPVKMEKDLKKYIEIYNNKILPEKKAKYVKENPTKKNPFVKLKVETAALISSYLIYKFFYKNNKNKSYSTQVSRNNIKKFHYDPKQYVDFLVDRDLFIKRPAFYNPKTNRRETSSSFMLNSKYYNSKYKVISVRDKTTLNCYYNYSVIESEVTTRKLKRFFNYNLQVDYHSAKSFIAIDDENYDSAKQSYMVEQIYNKTYFFSNLGEYDCLKSPIYFLEKGLLEMVTYEGKPLEINDTKSYELEMAIAVMSNVINRNKSFFIDMKNALTIGNKSYLEDILQFIDENVEIDSKLFHSDSYKNNLVDNGLLKDYKDFFKLSRTSNRIDTIEKLKSNANTYLFSQKKPSDKYYEFTENYLYSIKELLLAFFGNERVLFRVMMNISNQYMIEHTGLKKPIFFNKNYILKVPKKSPFLSGSSKDI